MVGHSSFEWFIDDGRTHVDDPLLRRLREVLVVRKERFDVWVVGDELQDLFDCEALVLWDVVVLDLVVQEVALLLIEDVLQKVDGRVVCTKSMMRRIVDEDLP